LKVGFGSFPFMWHQGRLADRGEMVSQLCRMAAIEKAFGQTESWPLMLKASHHPYGARNTV